MFLLLFLWVVFTTMLLDAPLGRCNLVLPFSREGLVSLWAFRVAEKEVTHLWEGKDSILQPSKLVPHSSNHFLTVEKIV